MTIKNSKNIFITLFKHFFMRLLKNDMFNENNNLLFKFLYALALISSSITFITIFMMQKYMILPKLRDQSWMDLSIFFMVSMSTTGIIAILEWRVLFPDLKDRSNLNPLPINLIKLYLAKLLSIISFIFILTCILILFPTILFTSTVIYKASIIKIIAITFFSFFIANLSVFFFVSFLNGILHLLLSEKIRELSGFFIQLVFVVIFISALVISFGINPFLFDFKQSSPSLLLYFPQLWFSAIVQLFSGYGDKTFLLLSKYGIYSFLSLFFSYLIILFISFKNKNLKVTSGINLKSNFAKKYFDKIFLKSPESKAIYLFLRNSFFRKFEILIGMASFLGSGISLILISYLNYFLSHGNNFLQTGGDILSSSTILYAVILGTDFCIKTQIDIKANWIIKLSESEEKYNFSKGIKVFIFSNLLIPIIFIFSTIKFVFSDFNNCFPYLLFNISIAVLAYELFFFKPKIFPFSHSKLPFSSKSVALWIIKLSGFLIIPSFSLKIWQLLSGNMIYMVLILFLVLSLSILKNKLINFIYPFDFDTRELDYFTSLNLSSHE